MSQSENTPRTRNSRVSDPLRLEVTFLTSAPSLAQCPTPDQPEVAFAGRSNAGKSSVLNRLTGNRHTAKVSKTPGRTQLINFFDVKGGGRVVDLPGYGYAKAGRAAQASWQRSVNEYLSLRESLVGVVLVMDVRHPLQPFDEEVIQWSIDSELPLRLLLNKADKLRSNARQQTLASVRRKVEHASTASVSLFSATKGDGQPELLTLLEGWLATNLS